MGSLIRGEYEEVVHVDDEPSLSDHILEEVIHEALKSSRGVVKTEEHNGRFEQSSVGDEGCLPLMSILDADIVVPPSDIELGEVFCILELIDRIRDEGEGVGISDGVFIQVVVVLAGMEFPILLLDKKERGGLGGIGGMDLPQG